MAIVSYHRNARVDRCGRSFRWRIQVPPRGDVIQRGARGVCPRHRRLGTARSPTAMRFIIGLATALTTIAAPDGRSQDTPSILEETLFSAAFPLPEPRHAPR